MTLDHPVSPWPDHEAVRALWSLDPEVAFLNHGSFGAAPLPVLDEQQRWRRLIEREPMDFFVRRHFEVLEQARGAVAAFLGADPEGLAFVTNATTGVATALASLELRTGDELLTTDHCYGAVRLGMQAIAERQGASVVTVALDLDDPDPAATLLAAVTERTRAVVVDAITSPTAWVLPVERIVAGCRERGVFCVIDAAHVSGQLPTDLRALDPDAWTGNLHKWLFTPKGCAVLYVRAELRERVSPLVLSHGTGVGFGGAFDWTGTFDPTAWLCAPRAIALGDELGWDSIRGYGRALARWGADVVAERCGLTQPLAADRQAQMALLGVGDCTPAEADLLRDRLWEGHRVTVAATSWRGMGRLRISGAPYNRPADIERLVGALTAVRGKR